MRLRYEPNTTRKLLCIIPKLEDLRLETGSWTGQRVGGTLEIVQCEPFSLGFSEAGNFNLFFLSIELIVGLFETDFYVRDLVR